MNIFVFQCINRKKNMKTIMRKYEYIVNGVTYVIIEDEQTKICDASDGSYHFRFNKETGRFLRWGHTEEEDPTYLPLGPEILDLEISSGKCSGSCPFCYKGNNASKELHNMTFETFKKVINKLPKSVCQIAFGICDINSNPDFFKMMEYARNNGIIPNFTTSGNDMTEEIADKVSKLCGAIAVSIYQKDKNIGYNTIKMLTDRGMTQINIHAFTSKESLSFVKEIMQDSLNDERLKKLNAIVFLGVKPKGKAKDKFNPLSMEEFGYIVEECIKKNIRFGFDSCQANKFQKWVENSSFHSIIKKKMIQLCEPCESFGMFSSYINDKGYYFPCSFCEGEGEFKEGFNVLTCSDFTSDIWNSTLIEKYRNMMIDCGRNCPFYNV